MVDTDKALCRFVSRMLNMHNVKKYGNQATMDNGFIIAIDRDKQGLVVSFTEVETKKVWVYRVVADTLEIIAYMDEEETIIHKCYLGELYFVDNIAYYKLIDKQHELVFKLKQAFDEFKRIIEFEGWNDEEC